MASEAGRQVVLVVDDDQHMRFLARRALERAGYAVQEADSATQADREVRQAPPNLVILDLMLPGTSGAQLLQRWRQDRIGDQSTLRRGGKADPVHLAGEGPGRPIGSPVQVD